MNSPPYINITTMEDQEEFQDQPGVNILVFGTSGCGGCRAAKNELLRMMNEHEMNLGFVEISDRRVKVEDLGSVPSFVIYDRRSEDGAMLNDPVYFEGFDKQRIEDILEN